MKKPSHLENPDVSPEHSPPGLTDTQKQTLLKVYRFLLGLRDKEVSGAALQKHTAPADGVPADEQRPVPAESASSETGE